MSPQPAASSSPPASSKSNMFMNIANTVILLISCLLIYFFIKLNSLSPHQFNLYPYNDVILSMNLILMQVVTTLLSIVYYQRQTKLRNFAWKEMMEGLSVYIEDFNECITNTYYDVFQ